MSTAGKTAVTPEEREGLMVDLSEDWGVSATPPRDNGELTLSTIAGGFVGFGLAVTAVAIGHNWITADWFYRNALGPILAASSLALGYSIGRFARKAAPKP